MQLIQGSPTKKHLYHQYAISIYWAFTVVTSSVTRPGDTTVNKTEKVPVLLELVFQTFLLLETSTRSITPIFNFESQLSSVFWFLFLKFRALWETVGNHVLSASKVWVNFSWVLTVTQWCFSSSYMYWVIPGCHTFRQTPHLCPSNDLHSPQSSNCLSPQTLGKQWLGLTLRNLKWGAWTRKGPRFHPTLYNTMVPNLLSCPAEMDTSNKICPRFFLFRPKWYLSTFSSNFLI